MKLSARNVVPGKIVGVNKGMTQSVVKIAVSQPSVLSATITNEAVEDLALKDGDNVSVIIKSTEVIVGKE
ncbi:MAG: TOBE domain-containing protein [Betaproteobacteria bacterium]|nr:TOBE domain-containing protein [Betaproteobacteria bacterium]